MDGSLWLIIWENNMEYSFTHCGSFLWLIIWNNIWENDIEISWLIPTTMIGDDMGLSIAMRDTPIEITG